MGIRLVICEKPSVAKDVARALSGSERFERRDWGYASDYTWVTAAAGHLVAELPPERYDEKYKIWKFEDLPILPEKFMYQPRDARAGERLKAIKELIHDPEVTTIVNAADAGREGELIAKLIIQYSRIGEDKEIKRAWFSSMTDQAIMEAFSNLRPDIEMKPLEAAARCRSEADWYVGMNATRGATTTLGGRRQLISVGRVQTPTLAIVVNRDLEIENFVPEDFATLSATFEAETGVYEGTWRSSMDADAQTRFDTQEEAKAVESAVKAADSATVKSYETKRENVNPPKLFDLTSLQREANSRYGMTAAATLAAAQACYETHKVLSYPRTDSSYITDDMAPTIPNVLAAVAAADPLFKTSVDALNAEGADAKVLVNNAKVTDHHGLLPVAGKINLAPLSKTERQIFDLVTWRMLAALGKPQVLDRTVIFTEVDASAGPVLFRSAGKVIVDEGWKAHWPVSDKKEEDAEETLCEVSEGENVSIKGTSVKMSKTKPPAHFTEATLLGIMATAGKLVDDEELAEAMKESGLGTPATRAATIEKLIHVEYIERSGKKLLATAKGRGVILALGDHPLTKAELTGSWERRLREMEKANPSQVDDLKASFVADAQQFTTEIVSGFAELKPDQMLAGRKKLTDCPNETCEGSIVAGRRGWGCDSWVSKEEPGCGVIIWKEQNGKKLTEKAMLKLVEDMRAGKAPLPKPPTPAVEIADCPSDGCEGRIVTRAKSFGCNSWKSPKDTGCGFVIWRNEGRDDEVDEAKALEMIAKGETNAGASNAEVLADCPNNGCSGSIVVRAKSFGCNSWKSPKDTGCGFVIWRNEGRDDERTKEVALQMIAEGKSDAKPVFAKCPKARCKGSITDFGKVLSCSTNKRDGSGCGVKVWRFEKDGTEKPKEQLEEELAAQGPAKK